MSHQHALGKPLAEIVPAAILDTILAHLATIFLAGAGNDLVVARQAAAQALAGHHPRDAMQLCLAASIVSFGFHALEALAQAADPSLPLTRILRLRGNAVSLNREAGKAQRRLDQLQQQAVGPRHAEAPSERVETPPEPVAAPSPVDPTAPSATKDAQAIDGAAKINTASWSRTEEDRLRDQRIAASVRRAEARFGGPAMQPPPQTAIPAPHAAT